MTDDPYKRLRRPFWTEGAARPDPISHTQRAAEPSSHRPRRIAIETLSDPDDATPESVHDAPTRPAAPAAIRRVPSATPPEMGANAERIDTLLDRLEHQQELTRAEMVRARHAELELEKAKERIEREAAKNLQQSKRALLLGFLDLADDLDRAIAAAEDAGSANAVVEGVELVRKNFHRKLADHGVKHRPSLGQHFDPTLHEAISMVPTQDPARDGEIIAVVREGYDIGGEVLRPASVAVAKSS